MSSLSNFTKNRGSSSSAQPSCLHELISELKRKRKDLRDALDEEVHPRGVIEKMYRRDLEYLMSEIGRVRRAKTAIENTEYREALLVVLNRLMPDSDHSYGDVYDAAQDLALRWFTDRAAQKEVAALLEKFGLDQSAIEGEIVRSSLDTIVKLDGLLSSLEERRIKILRALAEYRSDLRPCPAASSNTSSSRDGGGRKVKE